MLDAPGRHSVMKLLDRLKGEGKTIISVTHDMEEAAQADRILLVDHGQIICDEGPAAFFSRDLSHYRLKRPLAAEISAHLRASFPWFPHPIMKVEGLLAEWDTWRQAESDDATE